jgi:hypothetical protein
MHRRWCCRSRRGDSRAWNNPRVIPTCNPTRNRRCRGNTRDRRRGTNPSSAHPGSIVHRSYTRSLPCNRSSARSHRGSTRCGSRIPSRRRTRDRRPHRNCRRAHSGPLRTTRDLRCTGRRSCRRGHHRRSRSRQGSSLGSSRCRSARCLPRCHRARRCRARTRHPHSCPWGGRRRRRRQRGGERRLRMLWSSGHQLMGTLTRRVEPLATLTRTRRHRPSPKG